MRNSIFFGIVLIMIDLLVSCGDQKIGPAVKETIGKTVIFDHLDSLHSKRRFTILRVMDNPSCSSCELRLGDWKVYGRRLQRDFGNSINIERFRLPYPQFFAPQRHLLSNLLKFIEIIITDT